MQCLIQNVHCRGLHRSKNVSFLFGNDHFERKRNEESGLYGQTLNRLVNLAVVLGRHLLVALELTMEKGKVVKTSTITDF